jgi:hypothetical protein
MTVTISCSWCHEHNPIGVDFCASCGHRSERPRMDCDCPQCGGPRDERR